MPCTTQTVEIEKESTTLTLEEIPDKVNPSEEFEVSGVLSSEGDPVEGKTVHLYIDGVEEGTRTTKDFWGSYTFNVTLYDTGDHEIYTKFEGSKKYKSSKSSTHTVTVKKEPTSLTLEEIPKGVSYGEEFELSGVLSSEGDPVEGKTVHLYIDGVEEGTQTTKDFWGSYTFNVTLYDTGDHEIYVKFEGGSKYQQATSPTETVTVYERPCNVNYLSFVTDGDGFPKTTIENDRIICERSTGVQKANVSGVVKGGTTLTGENLESEDVASSNKFAAATYWGKDIIHIDDPDQVDVIYLKTRHDYDGWRSELNNNTDYTVLNCVVD